MASKVVKIVLIALAGFLVLSGVAYVCRDPLATGIAGFVLDHNEKARCTRPEIRISKSLQLVTLSPFECKMLKPGPLKAFEANSDVVLELSGLKLTRIHMARATMEQRDRDVPEVESNALGDVSNLVGVRDKLIKGMLDASDMFSGGGPVMEADQLVAKRAGKVESVMKGFRRTSENGWDRQRAARMEGGGAPDFIALRDFDMRVTKTRGMLSLAVHFGKPKRDDEPDIELKLDARGLDRKSPHVSMSL